MRSPIRVLLPHVMSGNPYLGLLSTALREEGVMVDFIAQERLPFLRNLRRANRPDVIHLQWQHTFFIAENWLFAVLRTTLFFAQILALKACGVSLVWTVHNLVNHEDRLAAWELFASRLLARSVDRVIVHCRNAVAEVATTYRIDSDRIDVVPHGHFGEAYPPPIDRALARQSLGLAQDETIILFFGQVREYKGVGLLIEAFARVKPPTAHLVVVGDPKPPSLGERIIEIAAGDPQITVRLEHLDTATLTQFVSACDVVALPYLKSLTSGTSVLAASMARPIIAPKFGCLTEMPESSAIFYDGDSPDALGDALVKSLDAPLDEMGRAAKDYISQYPWSRVASELREIYADVLTRKTAR